MSYLLDTDTVSYAMRGQGGVAERLLIHQPSAVAVSASQWPSCGSARIGSGRSASTA
jgi:hypothetical protein